MHIYDCFTFYNELDLLELRLHELSPVVDYFVLVEMERTFQNKPKRLFFGENQGRFRAFSDRIIHVIIPEAEVPHADSSWCLEYFQRNQIVRGLNCCCGDDRILIGDVDEIPRPSEIAANLNHAHPVRLEQDFFYYYFNCRCIEERTWTHGTCLLPYHSLTSPQEVRRADYPRVSDAGWHFSYIGGVTAIINKIESFGHAELNIPANKIPEEINKCMRQGLDLYGRNLHFEKVAMDFSFPLHLSSHIRKYQQYLI